MGLTVAEIRDRAERFRSAFVEEIYEARAGRKSWPELAPLYASQPILAFEKTIPVIERELAAASGEEERRLRRLRQWAAEHHVLSATAALDDEFARWVNTATLEVEGAEIPVSQVTAVVEATVEREERRQLDDARADLLEEALPLQLDRLSRWRAAANELGYGDYLQATERLSGVNLAGLLHEARRLVTETEDMYRDHLREQLRVRVGAEPDEAEGHDADWLARMKWLDGSWEEAALLRVISQDLTEIGLPLRMGDRVTIEHEAFPGPGMTACCAPVRVPNRIYLLVTPSVTQPGCTALLAEIGKALHWAYTNPRLPFEYRAVGDFSVVEAHGAVFAGLARSRPWTRRVRGFGADELNDYLRLAAFVDLYWIRRAVARLEFDLELARSERPAAMGPRWAELLQETTGFRFDPRTYLERLGQRFGAARTLRARMLGAQLQRELRERFDEEWYRNPRAGPFLGDWCEDGLRLDAVERAAGLGEDRLGADALLASIQEGLG